MEIPENYRGREQAKQEHRETRTGQFEMFSASQDMDLICQLDLYPVREYWLERLSTEPRQFGIETLADMLEETDWFERDLQAALRELIAEGWVKNIDAKRKRPVNAINFEKNERLVRIV